MGINAISCEGLYAETGKTRFCEGTRSASDFKIDADYAPMAFAMAVMGFAIYAQYEKSRILEQARYDKNNSNPISAGRVTDEYNGRFGPRYTVHLVDEIPADVRKADIVLRRSLDNPSNDGTRPPNICRFEREIAWPEPPHSYLIRCIERTDKDGIEIGDYVGVYRVVFESEK